MGVTSNPENCKRFNGVVFSSLASGGFLGRWVVVAWEGRI